MARLEGEMEALGEERDELQAKVGGFDAKRNGYSELQEWTEAAEALGGRVDALEEKWLALAERARRSEALRFNAEFGHVTYRHVVATPCRAALAARRARRSTNSATSTRTGSGR